VVIEGSKAVPAASRNRASYINARGGGGEFGCVVVINSSLHHLVIRSQAYFLVFAALFISSPDARIEINDPVPIFEYDDYANPL
jgi:hypothetical protein